MKKVLLGVCMLFTLALSAQTMKGNWLAGGNVGFDSYKVKDADDSETHISFAPNLGYFVIDNLAVGAAIGYHNYKLGDVKNSSFGVGPFVRYYFLNLGESAKLMAQASYTLNSVKAGDADSVSGSTLGLAAGVAYFLNPHVALEGILGYTSDSGDLGEGSGFGLNVGFQIHLGGN